MRQGIARALFAALPLVASCSRGRETQQAAPAASPSPRLTSRVVMKASTEWRDAWESLAQRPAAYGPGSEWELLKTEATPFGPKQTSTVWVLLELVEGGTRGSFEVRTSDGGLHQQQAALHHSWERPVAEATGRLYDPPADPAAMPIGCTLERLVRVKVGGVP